MSTDHLNVFFGEISIKVLYSFFKVSQKGEDKYHMISLIRGIYNVAQ